MSVKIAGLMTMKIDTFLPLQHAATLIFSVDWGLEPTRRSYETIEMRQLILVYSGLIWLCCERFKRSCSA